MLWQDDKLGHEFFFQISDNYRNNFRWKCCNPSSFKASTCVFSVVSCAMCRGKVRSAPISRWPHVTGCRDESIMTLSIAVDNIINYLILVYWVFTKIIFDGLLSTLINIFLKDTSKLCSPFNNALFGTFFGQNWEIIRVRRDLEDS